MATRSATAGRATKKVATTKAAKKIATTKAAKKVATTKAATKKAATKEAATKKAATKKAATKKAATTKAATTKAATKKAATTKAATKKAATTKAATKKAATTKAATTKAATTKAMLVDVPQVLPVTGPVRALRDDRFGPPGGGSGRFGAVALGGGRAVWSRVANNRVGWLSLVDGSHTELFPFDSYATAVGTDGSTVVGIKKGEFVILDPRAGKKPVRIAGAQEYANQIVVTSTHILALQSSDDGNLFIHDRAAGTSTTKVKVASLRTGFDSPGSEIAPTGHAALLGDDVVQVLAPPWKKTEKWPLPALTGKDPMGRTGARALGIANDGSRVAVLTFDAVYVLDGTTVVRVPAPSPTSEVVEQTVRGHVYARSWVKPLPCGQVLVLDKTHGRFNDDACEELVLTIYDVASAKPQLVHRLKLLSDVDHCLATSIAIDDHQILLSQSRRIVFVR